MLAWRWDQANEQAPILSKVVCVMSDHAASERHTDELLQDMKAQQLESLLLDDWDKMSIQKHTARIVSAGCALHVVALVAECVHSKIKRCEPMSVEQKAGGLHDAMSLLYYLSACWSRRPNAREDRLHAAKWRAFLKQSNIEHDRMSKMGR